MSKRKWYTKAIYTMFALALVAGLTLVPAVSAADPVLSSITTDPAGDAADPIKGEVTITVTATDTDDDLDYMVAHITLPTAFPCAPGPPESALLGIRFDADEANPTKSWVAYDWELAKEIGFVSATYNFVAATHIGTWTIVMDTTKKCEVDDNLLQGWGWNVGQEVCFDGNYNISVTVYDDEANSAGAASLFLFDNDETMTPTLALDAKGSEQIFWVNYVDYVDGEPLCESDLECCCWLWDVIPGVMMHSVGLPGQGKDITVMGGGRPGIGGGDPCAGITPDRFIEIWSRAPELGDCSVKVYAAKGLCPPEGPECEWEEVASGEKKWGELHCSTLDVNDELEGVQHTRDVQRVDAGPDGEEEVEVLEDNVWATFLQLPDPEPCGHALVHWWLAKDTTDNQDWVDALMADIVARAGDEGFYGCEAGDDPYVPGEGPWSATGKYAAGDHPQNIIDDWITDVAGGGANPQFATDTDFTDIISAVPPPGEIAADGWYASTKTEDAMPGEVEGRTQIELTNTGEEKVMIIVLVEYQDDYNGENLVLIQKGKKNFWYTHIPVPEICQVKVPQVRWAGEKIVLEKDWFVEEEENSCLVYTGNPLGNFDYSGHLVGFFLEEGCIGNLIPSLDTPAWASDDARTVFTFTDGYGVARAILESEQQGQADVKCVLYSGEWRDVGSLSFDQILRIIGDFGVIGNHGFLVYYLALEEVEALDVPGELEPGEEGDAADVTVQVKGWFTSDALPGTARPAVPGDGVVYERPAGRYVLPDDWAALAGSDEATSSMYSRPQYDLMNTPGGDVTSAFELGPFDADVRTPADPVTAVVEAEYPCIGPFSTLQPWSCVDDLGNPINMWIADAVVPADSTVDADPATIPLENFRNTVVPDGTIDAFDCPMPQALVYFEVDSSALSQLDKGAAGLPFIAPFYAVEIPSNLLIPISDYLWDSWGWAAAAEGPYDYWTDLNATPVAAGEDNLAIEVYCDNHGVAGVTIDALEEAGTVNLTVIADFPVLAAKYVAVDTEIAVVWGEGNTALPGDANGDGVVNALDITYLEMIIAGIEDETPGADANQDGDVNALDITYLEMIIAGIV